MNSFGATADLPVFQVFGKSETEEVDFIRRLLCVLERRTLYGTFLNRQECRNRHTILSLTRLYDLIMIDRRVGFPARQIRIDGCGDGESDPNGLVWSGGSDRGIERFADQLIELMDELVRRTPVWGCVLIGGKSSRMGRPKHLIEDDNKTTWLERTVTILRPLLDGLVVSGAGRLPDRFGDMVRLADIPGVAGPLAGILAAVRWQPLTNWLLVACDMPQITPEAIRWLLAGRRAGCWGRVPRLAENNHCEPLFAWYDFRAGQLFEQQLCDGNLRIGDVACHAKIESPLIPEVLQHGWQNINTPEQLKAVSDKR